LHPELLNANFVGAEYAVRGELYLKGEELRKQGKEIIFTNGRPTLLPYSIATSIIAIISADLELPVHASRDFPV